MDEANGTNGEMPYLMDDADVYHRLHSFSVYFNAEAGKRLLNSESPNDVANLCVKLGEEKVYQF